MILCESINKKQWVTKTSPGNHARHVTFIKESLAPSLPLNLAIITFIFINIKNNYIYI